MRKQPGPFLDWICKCTVLESVQDRLLSFTREDVGVLVCPFAHRLGSVACMMKKTRVAIVLLAIGLPVAWVHVYQKSAGQPESDDRQDVSEVVPGLVLGPSCAGIHRKGRKCDHH